MRRLWLAFAFLAGSLPVVASAQANVRPHYYLPWEGPIPGVDAERVVTTGNSEGGHGVGQQDEFGWDFDDDVDNWYVRAARTGTIVALRDNQPETPQSPPGECNDSQYSDNANYVRIQHQDGDETLYTHLKQGSVAALGLAVGQAVVRHSIIGRTDLSGRSCGDHLHYQVQDHCALPPNDNDGFCDSLPSSFLDPNVLAQDPDGIPHGDGTYVSGNLYESESTWPPQGWANFNNLGKPTTTGLTSGVDPSSWAQGRVDSFARGSTNAIVWKIRTSGGWQGSWNTSPGAPSGLTIRGGPTAVSWGPNRIDLFARGSDDQLWHRVWIEPGPWSVWEDLDAPEGGLTADPDVSSWAANRLDVFARGVDNKLWHRAWTGSPPWSDWEALDGSLTSAPSAVSWGPNRIDVFVRGASNHLYHRVYIYGSGWFLWENLCNTPYPNCSLTSAPDAASWVTDRIDVFVRGASNYLYHRVWASGWVNFASLCGGQYPTCTVTEDPGAVSWGFGRIDAFVRGSDNGLYQRRYGL